MRTRSVLLVALLALAADDPQKTQNAAPANRLARESSPYLLQHAHNPVDWYPWGPEAFEKARKEEKPIFLSVGYSACFWCHVMERESFVDPAIARVLNQKFVCIKVDREERPDVDAAYMAALQRYAGSGGWPMTLFLFPDGRPFFGATYMPPRDRDGMEGFATILDRVAIAWRDRRDDLNKDADALVAAVRKAETALAQRPRTPLKRSMLDDGQGEMAEEFDPDFGGFGYDPANSKKAKFPGSSGLLFLAHRASHAPALAPRQGRLKGPDARTMLLVTIDHMARGGIRDQLAGGFHRYSTNRSWSVPHFEKMLYDNAQLAIVYTRAYELTKDERWRGEVEATLAFLKRSMTSPRRAFYSAIDAETNGEEGAYYVWTEAEVQQSLGKGEDFEVFSKVYGLDRGPNFEGDRFVLRQSHPRGEIAAILNTTPQALEKRLAPMRAKLLAAREKRPAPRLDDKILTAWNGLTIAAYAEAFRVFGTAEYREAAEKAADFLLTKHRAEGGRLLRTSRGDGQAKGAAYLEDYASLAYGLLRLHAATNDAKRLEQARALTDRMMLDFSDPEGGYFFAPNDGESLFLRTKDPFDDSLPSGNSLAIANLVELARLTGEAKYLDAAGKALDAFSPLLTAKPSGAPMMLIALDGYLALRDEAEAKPGAGLVPGIPAKSVLTASAELAPGAKAAAGAEVEAVVTLAIDEGWHIAANPSGSEVVKATTVEVAAGSPATLVKADYPKGKTMKSPGGSGETMEVYKGKATIRVRLRLGEGAEPGPVDLVVKYQPCNDRACLAPALQKVTLMIEGR